MLKLFLEILPLVAFFIAYKLGGIMLATCVAVISALTSLTVLYIFEKKISNVQIISSIIIITSGSFTLISGNPLFIKMKPTILYLLIASSLFLSSYINKPILEKLFRNYIIFHSKRHWKTLSIRCAIFYLILACTNEYIWRVHGEAIWITFKVFATIPIILLFIICQIPFILKYKSKKF